MGSVCVIRPVTVTELISSYVIENTSCHFTEINMTETLTKSQVVNKETPASTYEDRRREHLAAMRQQVPGYLERLAWSREQLRSYREARLRALLLTARERSSWHRERLGHIDIATLGEDDLTQIPVMTKHDLMGNYDQIVTNPSMNLDLLESHLAGLTTDAYLGNHFHGVASGGSSGLRGVYVYDWESWIDCYLTCLRYVIRTRLRNPEPALRPVLLAVVTAEHATHMSSALPQTFSDPESTVVVRLPITLPIAQIVEGLNEAQPDALVAYPSVLPELAHKARAGQLRIAPNTIISVSEPLLPEIRAIAEQTWGGPIMNWWASSEGGGMGISCDHGPYMHLSDDLLIIEPVDANGRPTPPGVQSDKIHLTNLFNPLLPLIRFEITDQITVVDDDEPCPCGSTHRRIEDVHGRRDDLFVYPGVGAVHPHLFRSRLGRNRNIVDYQVRQTKNGADISIRCLGDVGIPGLQTDLTHDLIKIGLIKPDINLYRVDRLDRQATGKLKRFVPLAMEEQAS
jgi:phenylacetate-CoA ligase